MLNKTQLLVISLPLLAALGLVACQPIVKLDGEATAPTPAAATLIVLPDGTECAFAGQGATLAFEGQRLNYTCGENDAGLVGILGDVSVAGGHTVTINKALIVHSDDGFTLDSSEVLEFPINFVELASGEICASAGQGATLAFDDKRLNYTCSEAADQLIGLLGDLITTDAGGWMVEKAVVVHGNDGFALDNSELALVAVLSGGQTMEGAADMEQSNLIEVVWAWQQTTMNDDTIITPDDPSRYTLEFMADDTLAVQADCNRGRGTYSLKGNQLTIGPVATTLMACPPGSLDSVFLSGLNEVGSYLFDGDNLVLELKLDSGIMVFGPITSTPTASTAGNAPADLQLDGILTGTVLYRQRIALPAGSVVEIQLQDVSKADAPAEIIASQAITTSGENVPIPFALTYDPATIAERNSYALSARILVNGELAWINTTRHTVLTQGAPTSGVVVLVNPSR